MNRKSTQEIRVGIASSENIKFTGLRPSWDAFWEMEASGVPPEFRETTPTVQSILDRLASSATSTIRSERGTKNVKFVTSSEWSGEWDNLGMCGMGIFKMPHGVTYEGTMNSGRFQGRGVLRYPNGGVLEGFWNKGNLKYCQYIFGDGLKRESPLSWTYCRAPDRRFHSEMQRGLRAADTEQLSQEDPHLQLPPGMYDTGDGIYSPLTKCVTDRHTGEVLRIPTVAQEEWILKNCRVGVGGGDPGVVGFRPEFYENWYAEEPEDSSYGSDSRTNFYKEVQEYLRQRGCDFGSDSVGEAVRSTLINIPGYFRTRGVNNESSIWSKSMEDLELFMKRLMKDSQRSDKTPDESYDRVQFNSEEEAFMIQILNEVYSYLSLKKSLSDKTIKTKNNEINPSDQCAWPRNSQFLSSVNVPSTSSTMESNVSTKTLYDNALESISDMPRSGQPSGTEKALNVTQCDSCCSEIELEEAVHDF